MDEHTAFRLKLPNGVVIELEGEKEYVEQNKPDWERIESLVKATVGATPPTPTPPVPLQSAGATAVEVGVAGSKPDYTSEELKEFLKNYKIKNSPQQQVAAFAYFLQALKKWPSVTYEDLEECFNLSNLKIPEVKKAVGNSERRFKLVERLKDGTITMTRIGRNFIEDRERKEPARVSRSSANPVAGKSSVVGKKRLATIPRIKGDLDLFGNGGVVSFKDFVKSKNVDSNASKFAICAYYIIVILGHERFDESDVYTCFSHMDWKSPEYVRNNIINHKNQFGFYDMVEGGFKITMTLKNYVEHELKAKRADKGDALQLN